jgi:hypothetical protein
MASQPTSIAAWYGATLSTLGFALALYVALRDRSRLKISVQKDMQPWGETEYDSEKLYVAVTVANVGRRTVTVSAVWFTQKRRAGDIFLGESVRKGPQEITEGKSAIFMADQEAFPLATLARVMVRDQAGRIWKGRIPRSVRQQPPSPDKPSKARGPTTPGSRPPQATPPPGDAVR